MGLAESGRELAPVSCVQLAWHSDTAGGANFARTSDTRPLNAHSCQPSGMRLAKKELKKREEKHLRIMIHSRKIMKNYRWRVITVEFRKRFSFLLEKFKKLLYARSRSVEY